MLLLNVGIRTQDCILNTYQNKNLNRNTAKFCVPLIYISLILLHDATLMKVSGLDALHFISGSWQCVTIQ
jgi:hypothetical protein